MYAIEILEKGIELHPDYATAYLIYALAHAYSGDDHQAHEAVERAAALLSSKKILDYYTKKIELIIAERNSLMESKRPTFIEAHEEPDETNKFFKFEDNLEILAEELNNAKIKVDEEDDSDNQTEIPEYKGGKIVSETLAGIYYNQKKYEEAVSVYTELIKKNPDKEDYYTQKIVEIETLM